jgi:hypothetical protein
MIDKGLDNDSWLPSKARQGLDRFGWPSLGVLALAGLGLSFLGFFKEAPKTDWAPFLTAFYKSLLGFWFNASTDHASWQLQVGRLITLAAAAVAAGGVLAEIGKGQIRSFLANHMKGHIILCGLGELGTAAAETILGLDGPQGRLTIIEQSPSVVTEAFVRRGARMVVGDATDPGTLLKARVDRATHVLACCGDSDRNASIAHAAKCALTRGRSASLPALSVRVHIDDASLLRQLRARLLQFSSDRVDVDFFCVAELAAQQVVEDTIPLPFKRGTRKLDAVVLGNSLLAEQVVLHLAHLAAARGPQNKARPTVCLACPNAPALAKSLQARHPQLQASLKLSTVTPEGGHEEATPAFLTSGVPAFTKAFVCTRSDLDTMRITLALSAAISEHKEGLGIVACIYGRSGFAKLIEDLNLESIKIFDATNAVRGADTRITLGTLEHLARVSHHLYYQGEMLKPAQERSPKGVPWTQLDHETQENNRDQVRKILELLGTAHYRFVPRGDPGTAPIVFPRAIIWLLAKAEHRRWFGFMTDRGWTQGKRDDSARKHECCVPWGELKRAKDRRKDLDKIREIPALLAEVGIGIAAPAEGPASPEWHAPSGRRRCARKQPKHPLLGQRLVRMALRAR